jgi:hypothetical protein
LQEQLKLLGSDKVVGRWLFRTEAIKVIILIQ